MTTNGGTMTVTIGPTSLDSNGNMTVILHYIGTTSGNKVVDRVVFVPAGAGPIVDSFGAVVAASVPGALATAMTGLATQIATTVSNGATGGKLDL